MLAVAFKLRGHWNTPTGKAHDRISRTQELTLIDPESLLSLSIPMISSSSSSAADLAVECDFGVDEGDVFGLRLNPGGPFRLPVNESMSRSEVRRAVLSPGDTDE